MSWFICCCPVGSGSGSGSEGSVSGSSGSLSGSQSGSVSGSESGSVSGSESGSGSGSIEASGASGSGVTGGAGPCGVCTWQWSGFTFAWVQLTACDGNGSTDPDFPDCCCEWPGRNGAYNGEVVSVNCPAIALGDSRPCGTLI